ncbi:MAG TPA: pseudouridine synthase [Phycisphaerales bacterium]|nr:pseudouridine synthase [Phycisphaerales bacterium]
MPNPNDNRRPPPRRGEDRRRAPKRSGPRGPLKASPKGAARRDSLPGGINIVHEDDDLIVIDKPSGLLTAGMPGEDVESVFRSLKVYIKDQHRRRGTKVWIIHRLDKEASGLLVFAKSERAFEFLKEEFRAKRPHRLYSAVVEGEIASDSTKVVGERRIAQPASGTVQSYLMEDEKGIVHSFKTPTEATRAAKQPGFRVSDSDGHGDHAKLAVTHWRVIEAALGRSLLQVRLETGRKNQIRVHMKDIQHPIVGDRRYGAATDPIGRVCLHAMELGFTHPATGQTVRYRSVTPGPFHSLIGRSKPDDDQEPFAQAIEFPPTSEARARIDAAGASHTPAAAEVPSARAKGDQPSAAPRTSATDWDHVADWYSDLIEERRSDHHELVILPGVTRLLALTRGQRVLDVACGQGILAHRLASLGANVVGVDAAPRLIEAAQRGASPAEQFQVGDARAVGSMDLGAPFDASACVMALMNIDPLAPVLSGIAAKLRSGGRFVAVILHPAFRAPGQTSWGFDEPAPTKHKTRGREFRQYRRVDGYLSPGVSPIVMNPGAVSKGEKPVTTVTFHRPIQTYVNALAAAGLLVDAMEEWPSVRSSQPGPRAAEENRARREIPMFLALRAIRTG